MSNIIKINVRYFINSFYRIDKNFSARERRGHEFQYQALSDWLLMHYLINTPQKHTVANYAQVLDL